MKKKITILLIIICFIIFNNFENNFQKRISHLNYDFFQKLFETEPNTNEVIIVDIDEKSLKQLGQFPWRRDIHSTIINNLNAATAKVIAFDIFFSEPDKQNPQLFIEEFNLQNQNNIMFDSDQLLSDTIEKSNVILPVVGAVEDKDFDQILNIKANLIKRGENPSNYLYTFNSLITSLPKFNEKAKGLGTISIIEGEDGILRSVPMMINVNDTIVPALSLEAIRLFNDQKSILIERIISNKDIDKNISDNFKFSAAVAGFGMLLRDSEFKGDCDFELVKELAQNSKGKDDEGYRSEFIRLVKLAENLQLGYLEK